MTKGIFTISLVIFPYDVIVSYAQNDKEIKSSLHELGVDEKTIKDVTLYPISSYNGLCVPANNNLQVVIRIKKGLDKYTKLGVVVHEVTHATIFIYDAIGSKLTIDSSDEFYCYMNQYLTTEIMKKIE